MLNWSSVIWVYKDGEQELQMEQNGHQEGSQGPT